MLRQPVFLTLLFLALMGGGLVVVKPASPSQSSPAHRTFKGPEDDLDEFVGKVKTIHVEMEEHEFTTHFMDLGNRYKRKPFQTSQFDLGGRKVEKFNYRAGGVPRPGGSSVKKEKYTYEVDGHGNWIKKTLYHWVTEEGKSFYRLMNITHRTLAYYLD